MNSEYGYRKNAEGQLEMFFVFETHGQRREAWTGSTFDTEEDAKRIVGAINEAKKSILRGMGRVVRTRRP